MCKAVMPDQCLHSCGIQAKGVSVLVADCLNLYSRNKPDTCCDGYFKTQLRAASSPFWNGDWSIGSRLASCWAAADLLIRAKQHDPKELGAITWLHCCRPPRCGLRANAGPQQVLFESGSILHLLLVFL
eukprot:1937585-Amphidinium_carterae.2